MEEIKNNLLEKGNITSFVSGNKIWLAALGGVAAGLALSSLLGNERAREIVRTIGSSLADITSKVGSDFSGYKELIAPLFSKTAPQGL